MRIDAHLESVLKRDRAVVLAGVIGVTGGFQHDHSGKYAEYAEFEYSGP